MPIKFSFIGVGNIAGAIISAMDSLEGNLKTNHADVFLYDVAQAKTDTYKDQGYSIAKSIDECVVQADYVFLCVKPQNYREVLEYIKSRSLSLENKTFISVAAGISTSQICECIGAEVAVIRTMPNTPMTIGMGVCAICHNRFVHPKRFEKICRILSAKSELIVLDESKMNKIIGITSSSPAYVYKFIDSILDAAKAEGLDDPRMLRMICNVFIGSAYMVLKTDKDIKSLIQAVKSPNGTTERALAVFESNGLDDTILKAIRECNERAETLGEEM